MENNQEKEAKEHFLKALEGHRKAHGNESRSVANCQNNIGQACMALG